jgi:hypothetical protein
MIPRDFLERDIAIDIAVAGSIASHVCEGERSHA